MQAILEKGLALPEPSQVTPKRSPKHNQEVLITGWLVHTKPDFQTTERSSRSHPQARDPKLALMAGRRDNVCPQLVPAATGNPRPAETLGLFHKGVEELR